jgi:hypothetical protein
MGQDLSWMGCQDLDVCVKMVPVCGLEVVEIEPVVGVYAIMIALVDQQPCVEAGVFEAACQRDVFGIQIKGHAIAALGGTAKEAVAGAIAPAKIFVIPPECGLNGGASRGNG